MRILLINWQDRMNPQAGGAEIHLHEIFGRIVRGGHAVTLLASGWPGCEQREEVDGLEVHRVGSRYSFGTVAPGYYRRHLRKGFDLVVEALNKVPVFTPLWSRSPVVLLVHHLFGTTAFREASFPLAAMTWLMERPLGRVYRGVPVEVISRSTGDDLLDRGLHADDIRVIYPGVDLDFFSRPPGQERTSQPTFLYLGRLKRYKGVDLILKAIARLRGEGIGVRLIIGGKGEWEPQLRAAAESLEIGAAVDFVGFVTEHQKRELFRICWANVFPSPKEGWGITNLEAAACGTPAIASDSPGLRESVVHERTGLLVPHGDVEALACAMRRLAGDRGLVERLGSEATVFSRSFSWDRAAAETVEHLESIAASHARSAAGAHPRTTHS